MADKLATLCPHLDRPEKAKGRCGACYNAYVKAQKAAKAVENDQIRVEDNDEIDLRNAPAFPKGLDLDDDELAKKMFEKILWGWIFEGEQVVTRPDGADLKDFVRLKEVTASKSMKAATILGRKFIVEKKEIIQPTAIPVAGAEQAVGHWMGVLALGNKSNEINEDEDIDYDA
jgi:hypothetical protein